MAETTTMCSARQVGGDFDDFEVQVGGKVVRTGLNSFEAELFLAGFAACAEIYGNPVPLTKASWAVDAN